MANTSISSVQVAHSVSRFESNTSQPKPSETQQLQFGKSLPVEGKELPKTESARQAEPSHEELENMVDALNSVAEDKPPHMKFSIDEDTGRTVVTMTQRDTGEVVRQIPSVEFLNIAKMILETTENLVDQPGHFIEAQAWFTAWDLHINY